MIEKTNIVNIGDPFVLLENGTYYLYATSASDGFLVWKGTDLNKLEKVGYCLEAKNSFGDGRFWAPEVVKRKDGKFILHYTANMPNAGLRCGVAIADSPLGPFADVFPGKPMFDLGGGTIDATCFVDDDGSAYLYYSRDCWDNVVDGVNTSQIFAVRLDETLTRVVSSPVLVATPQKRWETHKIPAPCIRDVDRYVQEEKHVAFLWNEAPYVVKRNGLYCLTYSANCFDSRYYGVGLAVSRSPLGNFVKAEEPLLQINDGQTCGVGHSAFFTTQQNKTMMVFHCHTDYNNPSGNRRVCFCDGDKLLNDALQNFAL